MKEKVWNNQDKPQTEAWLSYSSIFQETIVAVWPESMVVSCAVI